MRGRPRAWSRLTEGESTAATIPAVIIGMTIVCVIASSAIRALTTIATPGDEPGHYAEVAQPVGRSEQPAKVARADLEDLRLGTPF